MVHVSNKKCIRNLSRKSLWASKTRNIIAIIAIALTTVLFTALFTIAISINDSFQEANFRQVGGYSHGTFKYLTEEQFKELKDDKLIKEYGLRRFIGMPEDVPFHKNHVELGFSDKNQAHWMYCDPIVGSLPIEGTKEAATDTKVLSLLGVEPKIGNEFSVTFTVNGIETTQTFKLCGWWEADEATNANHILIPESRVNAILDELNMPPGIDGTIGTWNLDVMFGNSRNISNTMGTILMKYGYQVESNNSGDNSIDFGVNWGYTGAQLTNSMDSMTLISIFAILLLIIFTGYLIIYNVFQISVVGDIRFYGLLKTIGTTGRQIKRIIRYQSLILSVIGIPIGLFIGWIIGAKLTPVILSQLNGVVLDVVSLNPLIFLVASIFSMLTVLLSCSKPGRLAAKVSPVEAIRYTDGRGSKKVVKRATKGISLFGMAKANLSRSRGKTIVTIVSLALAVVLLNATVLFTNGFDMDKYLASRSVSDFIVANAKYFQSGNLFSAQTAIDEDTIHSIASQGGITDSGCIYGKTTDVEEFVTEEYLRSSYFGKWNDEETLNWLLGSKEHSSDGKIPYTVQLYGMEPYILSKLTILEGDISKLGEPFSRYIAAVYLDDDYGNPIMDTNWARLGDRVTLRYVDEYEYYNPDTGIVYEDPDAIGNEPYQMRALKYKDVEYEVGALVGVPSNISYRRYGDDGFILNDQTFIQDTGTSNIMLYAFDTTKEANHTMEEYLSEYTTNQNTEYDYESKASYQAEFDGFRNMFLLLGGVLSFIVGLVGILNFINAILTGIIARKHEFAMLQSIGMTRGQLKTMLVVEGLLYAFGSILLSLLFSFILEPVAASALSSMFWFFTYHLTLTPILLIAPIFALLGCIVPLMVYRTVSKLTIVERLRDTDN